jgi:hypothetical protein
LLTREERSCEEQLGLVLIVGTAAQLDVLGSSEPARRKRPHVMELEKSGLVTSPSGSDEGAPAIVTPPDTAPHRRWNSA